LSINNFYFERKYEGVETSASCWEDWKKNALNAKGHKEGTNMGRLMLQLSRHPYQ